MEGVEIQRIGGPECPKCGKQMQDRILDEDEGRYYWECWNTLKNGEICHETEWE